VPAPSFDAAKWDYRRPEDTPFPIDFQMAWRPNSSQIFLYNDIQVGGYTFLLDIKNGQVCELNLFGAEDPNEWRKSWAMLARWSPNGRYLAVVRTKGDRPIEFSDLIILDAATGNLYQTDITKFGPSDLDIQGMHYISDVAWAPDNQHLAVIGEVNPADNLMPDIDRLFLLDFLTNKIFQVSSAELGPNLDLTTKLLWSNDGAQLIVQCRPGGLCILAVQKNAQP
jgi:dipeptidyl aminopeptidase/acylaminoacyl peptidase